MAYGDEQARPQMFEATRKQLAQLHAEIESELERHQLRLAALRAHDETARRMVARAQEILGIDPSRFATGPEL